MKRYRLIGGTTCLLLFLLGISGTASADSVGEISFLQGSVEVARGEQNHTSDVDFGFPLENFDQITTGSDGLVEVTLDGATGFEGTITVQPDTAFYIDLGPTDTGRSGAVELMAGSVGLTVRKLSPSDRFEVRSSNVVMGIRGTRFDVTTAVSGDLLVTVDEGRVACEDNAGSTLYAEPERAVEQLVDGGFQTVPVTAGKGDEFRRAWMERRLAAFREGAPRLIRAAALRYALLRSRFDRAYESLMANREILDRWFQEDRRQQPEDAAQALVERRRIMGALIQVRRTEYLFSRLYYRILALKRYYENVARWNDAPGFSTQQFFRRIENDRGRIAERLRTVRYIEKLFVKRGGTLALERLRDIEAAATR